MKELAAVFVLQAEELPPAECNQKERYVHVQLPVANTVVVHLHVLLPAYTQLRRQEAAVHVQVTVTLHLQEARVHILHLQEVAAVAGAVARSVAEVAVAVVQVAAAVAVVQVDADNERDNIIII